MGTPCSWQQTTWFSPSETQPDPCEEFHLQFTYVYPSLLPLPSLFTLNALAQFGMGCTTERSKAAEVCALVHDERTFVCAALQPSTNVSADSVHFFTVTFPPRSSLDAPISSRAMVSPPPRSSLDTIHASIPEIWSLYQSQIEKLVRFVSNRTTCRIGYLEWRDAQMIVVCLH